MSDPIQHFNLQKRIWTEKDFETMGWHDAAIYAFSFIEGENEWEGDFVLDIDYIFKWIEPINEEKHYSFWLAPCTLVFKNAINLAIDINTELYGIAPQEINDINLLNKQSDERGIDIYTWEIELLNGRIELKSEGYIQIVRLPPIFTDQQQLAKEQRGEISFSRHPYK